MPLNANVRLARERAVAVAEEIEPAGRADLRRCARSQGDVGARRRIAPQFLHRGRDRLGTIAGLEQRAEHRLLLRIDNADLRLTPVGREMGLVDDQQWERFSARRERFERNLDRIERSCVRNDRGERTPAAQFLRQPQVRLATLARCGQVVLDIDATAEDLDIASVETTIKYAGYLRQEAARADRVRRDGRRRIPPGFLFESLPGLSREVVQRLSQVQPETLGQASRIPGVTPAAVAVLGAFLDRPSPSTTHHRVE